MPAPDMVLVHADQAFGGFKKRKQHRVNRRINVPIENFVYRLLARRFRRFD